MSVTLKGLDEMQRELEKLAARGVGAAARETVNGLAFAGRAAWQEQMAAHLTLRNAFTQRRALVVQARHNRTPIAARLGHTEPYMERLERGGRERAAKRYRPIPTEIAAGQARGSLRGGRKRAVRPASIINRLGKLDVPRRRAGAKSRKSTNATAIKRAIRTGRGLALLDFGKRKGIYRVKGGKRGVLVSKLYDLTRKATPVPRIPTLEPALAIALAKGPDLAHAALSKQLARGKGTP